MTDDDLERSVAELAAETKLSGVVRVDRGDRIEVSLAFGQANRRFEVPNTVDTRFAIASGTKAFTALVVASLIEEGLLDLDTTARAVLGNHLPLIADDVTVEHLLSHTSGIGDYLDEDDEEFDLDDYLMPVPVHALVDSEDYLAVLDGFPTKFAAGERFSYCNGGYVVLAIIAERVAGRPYHQLVEERVCAPAGLHDSVFPRSDQLDRRAADGYLAVDGLRTNILHLPLRGVGDGGIYTTAADIRTFWTALFAGRIVPESVVAEMVAPRSDVPSEGLRYGRGFWLHRSREVVVLIGGDTGVSFYSAHDPRADLTHTVISNTTDGAWPIAHLLNERLTDMEPDRS